MGMRGGRVDSVHTWALQQGSNGVNECFISVALIALDTHC